MSLLQNVLLFIWIFNLFFDQTASLDPCTNYTELNDWRRSVSNSDVSSSICDSFLSPGWYRVTSGTGDIMPTECIHGGFRCGTINPIWMNGTYPKTGEVKNVTSCVSSYDGICCKYSYEIQIKNCSSYPVYYLVPPKVCPQAYCFGFELPCKEGETSPTGFTPGCRYEPCLEVNYKELSQWERSVNNTNTETPICDSFLEPGWYRPVSKAGELMPTNCLKNGFACGTVKPIWMNGTFPKAGEVHNVSGCSADYNGQCCANKYEIQVKNCSEFMIYNLEKTVACPEAYCFGTEVPCLEGESSETGFTPNCEIDPCHKFNHLVIKGQVKRSSNYTLTDDEAPMDDSQLTESFYRFDSPAGNDLVNTEQPMFQCGTKFPMYMKGAIPHEHEKTVPRTVCVSGYDGICQNQTTIKVRNCGLYRVYYLKPFPLPFSAYCVGELPVSQPDDTAKSPSENILDTGDLPWVITVCVLGVACLVLTGALVVKKCYGRSKVHEEKPPPPYSSVFNNATQDILHTSKAFK